jgi:hypothetical protein
MSYRKAAVLLHGVSAKDRKWLLANLPANADMEIRRLIKELESLGIPKDRMMLRSALDAARTIGKQRSLILKLDEYNHEAIHACLKDEPLFFVRRILSIHHWRWANDIKYSLLQIMHKKDGKQFLSSLDKSRISHKSELLLLESFLDKLEGAQPGIVALSCGVA